MMMASPNWDESKHPRWPAGSAQGGEFAAAGGPNWGLSPAPPPGKKDVFGKLKGDLKDYNPGSGDFVRDGVDGSGVFIAEKDLELTAKVIPADNPERLYLEMFTTSDTPEGRTAARKGLMALFDTAVDSGVKSIDLAAGLSSGGYVWPRIGFQLKDADNIEDLSLQVRTRLHDGKLSDLTGDLWDKVNNVVKAGGPMMASNLAHMDDPVPVKMMPHYARESKPTLGKAALLGTAFQATLPRADFGKLKQWAERVK